MKWTRSKWDDFSLYDQITINYRLISWICIRDICDSIMSDQGKMVIAASKKSGCISYCGNSISHQIKL